MMNIDTTHYGPSLTSVDIKHVLRSLIDNLVSAGNTNSPGHIDGEANGYAHAVFAFRNRYARQHHTRDMFMALRDNAAQQFHPGAWDGFEYAGRSEAIDAVCRYMITTDPQGANFWESLLIGY